MKEAGRTSFIVDNITKVFSLGGGLSRSSLVAVNKANFDIGRGGEPEIFTLAGESGSGKTTLARIALGLFEPTYGTIQYKGRDLVHIRKREDKMWFMKEVQPIFQNPFETFNPLKKVKTYLHETALNFGVANKGSGIRDILEESLELVGLTMDALGDKYPNEFSGGQLQRASIARSLITDPSILIADEPVSMVDASIRMSIVNLFKDLKQKRGVNVLYITHDLATAYYVSDRIAIMLRGNIVEMGTVEDVLGNPLHPYTKLLLESIPQPDPDQMWEKEIALSTFEEQEYAQKGCKFAGRCPHVMNICKREDAEDRYPDERAVKCHLYENSNSQYEP